MMSPLFLLVGGRRDERNDHAGASTPCTAWVQSPAVGEWAAPGTVANCNAFQLPATAVYFHTVLVTICSGVILHMVIKIACKSCMLCQLINGKTYSVQSNNVNSDIWKLSSETVGVLLFSNQILLAHAYLTINYFLQFCLAQLKNTQEIVNEDFHGRYDMQYMLF